MNNLRAYKEVWLVDFEFNAQAGERSSPVCMVAREVYSGRLLRIWADELRSMRWPPFSTDSNTLFVAYSASAKFGCFLALGWPMPERILDLFCEFRWLTCGLQTPCGHGLLGAMAYFRLDSLSVHEKAGMQELILRGEPFSNGEREAILEYCQTKVDALAKLLPAMEPHVDLPRALLRGRYMAAVARMEWRGISIDLDTLGRLKANWKSIQEKLIEEIDKQYGIYKGRTFKSELWEAWLKENNIPWPRLPTGKLALDDETFRERSKSYPEIAPVRELRTTLVQLRPLDFAIGADGRNRCPLSPFRAKTGRNQPSSSAFIFGPSVWLRSLIKPEPGMALAYVDWSQQELAIAAALSGDPKMQSAYKSGDFYLTFAKMAGAAPMGATKETHSCVREQFKTVALGVLYGLSAEGLARKLNITLEEGKELLRKHKETFRLFWDWSDSVESKAILCGKLNTVFGWTMHAGNQPNPRSLRNFPMQGNGAEMMRIACCLLTERGIGLCCSVHDALLVEAPLNEIDSVVNLTQSAMKEASQVVLDGFELRTDAKVIRYPERYSDKRGVVMWQKVMELCGGPPNG